MELLKLLEIFGAVWTSDFLRYFIPASTAFVIVWVILGNKLSHRFIQKKHPAISKLWFEFKYSMSTVMIFTLVGVGIVIAENYGAFHIYEHFDSYGWGYFLLSLGIMLIFHDAYFYWTHRCMHHPRVFKYVHRVHHLSNNPSPWAAYSFHPIEAIIQAMVLPIILLFLPVHPLTVFIFLLYMILKNVMGHLGYELFPKGFLKNRWFNWHTTTTHHSMHHQFYKGNYGLYFTWWDNWMNTTHKQYRDTFLEVTSRPRNSASMNRTKISLILLGFSTALIAQSPEGQWMTFDESTGNPQAIISIKRDVASDIMEGVVDSIIVAPHQGAWGICVKCHGAKMNQPLPGLEIIWGFEKWGGSWINGSILDPASGTIFHSKIWFESDDRIKVRGYGGPFNLFYRTQTWQRLQGSGIEGLWAAVDERYNLVSAHVELRTEGNELKGHIKKVFMLPYEGNYPICTECQGALKDQPIVGMRLMTGYRKKGNKWIEGIILDPGNGKTYYSAFWLRDDNTLVIRGYWGPFYRSQVWKRFSASISHSNGTVESSREDQGPENLPSRY